KPLYHAAWIGSRLGMQVTKPLAAMHVGGPRRPTSRQSALANPSAGLGASLRMDRTDVSVVIRPVVSEMPAGTTLRVELLADWRGAARPSALTPAHARARRDDS